MWPDRRLTDLLEIEHPLVLAPMAGFGTVELAAAVCAAGGLGSIGCGPVPPAARQRRPSPELRALTNKPINVNFFCSRAGESGCRPRAVLARYGCQPYYRELGIDAEPPPTRVDLPPFGDDMCKVVEDARPDVVSFHFGLPARRCWPASRRRVAASWRRRPRWRRRAGWKRVASMWSSLRAMRPEGIEGCSLRQISMPRSRRSRVRWRWCRRS